MQTLETFRPLPVLRLQPAGTARRAVAGSLEAAALTLGRLARRLRPRAAVRAQAEPVYEFYAESGAPEGALYIDGQLVGLIEGVNRL